MLSVCALAARFWKKFNVERMPLDGTSGHLFFHFATNGDTQAALAALQVKLALNWGIELQVNPVWAPVIV